MLSFVQLFVDWNPHGLGITVIHTGYMHVAEHISPAKWRFHS